MGGVHGENRLMGNSLQDIITFGRRAGVAAAEYVKSVKIDKLTLDHVVKFEKELDDAGIAAQTAPIILPDYATDEVLSRRWLDMEATAKMNNE
jgi:succinate dehydrogenase/fumarate reductase flavoprotein subunit